MTNELADSRLRRWECRLLSNTSSRMSQVLERGNIYFVYRPRVEATSVSGIEDVQRLFMILSPQGSNKHRLVVVGRKKLPEIESQQEKNWAFVQKVAGAHEIEDELDRMVYETKTRGERHLAAARPAGEGVYTIVRHEDHTHLAFALELPSRPGEVQEELNIPEQGSYIITVKNPEQPTPTGLGLPEAEKPALPERLRARLHGRRFVPADPPDFLDQEGTELVLIGADEDVFEELGIKLHPQRETIETAEIFNDLKMEPGEHPLKALFEGKWQ